MYPLVLNFLIYVFFSLYFFRKYNIKLVTLLWIWYALISLFSLIIWCNGIYHEVSGRYIQNELTFFPLLYNAFFILILFLPLLRINEENIVKFVPPVRSKIYVVIYPAMFLGIILILLMLFFIIKAGITHQFSFFYEYGKKYNIGIYPHYIELLFSIYSVFYIVLLLYFFIFLIYSRKFEPVFLIFLLISTFIPSILYGIGHASRGWLFFRLADIFICYVLFRKRISPKINKIIKLTLISVCFLAIVFSLSITYSRFGFGINGLLSILRYFGESFINFNVIIWNNVDIHPLGERLFPDIYQFIVGDITEFSSHYESRPYYTYLTNIPIHLFKTIIGDLYVAFGHIGMVLIIIFISFLGHRYIRYSPEFPFYRLIIYFYYYQLCFGGVFNFVKSGHVNFLIFIGLIIQYLYFRIDFSRNVLMKR